MVRPAIAALLFFSMSSLCNAQIASWEQEGWKTNFEKMAVAPSEILSGGPPKDGIPPIDNPKFVAATAVTDLTDRDPVIGLEINGDARAYPLRVMTWHEIVNDTVGGQPVVITYCPLCNSAIVFDALVNGDIHTFGTTGKLRNSDLVMYDRSTESWWQQFTGRAIAGAHLGTKLKLLPSQLEAWSDFKARYPNGKVLVPNNPSSRHYGRNPYVNYDIADRPFLFNGELPKDIPAMARVVVVRHGNKAPVVIAMAAVRENGTYETNGLILRWKEGQASALHAENISSGREVGTITVEARDDAGKEYLTHDTTFAFVAHAFFPGVAIKN
ncbi:MAG: DUF3179 domain-containing protein [Rhizobiaceae bacterium]